MMRKENTWGRQFVIYVIRNLIEMKESLPLYKKISKCSPCNLWYKENSYTPIITQKASGYDNHLMLEEIAERFKECDFLYFAESTEVFTFLLRKRLKKTMVKFLTKVIC